MSLSKGELCQKRMNMHKLVVAIHESPEQGGIFLQTCSVPWEILRFAQNDITAWVIRSYVFTPP